MDEKFFDVVIPEKYAYGAVSGPAFKTNVIIVNSGKEKRNVDWKEAMWTISINYQTQRKEEITQLENLFLNTYGRAYGFLFNNKRDNEILIDQGQVNENGLLKGKPRFKLYKKYKSTLTDMVYVKRIFKPIPGSVLIYNNGVLVNDFVVDYKTGTVTMPLIKQVAITNVSKAIKAVVTSNGHGFTVGTKVFIGNVPSMKQLSNRYYLIESVSTNNFTLNVNSLSFDTFVYDALNLNYVQQYCRATDNITWTGSFYLPVRFKEDTAPISYDNFNSFSCSTNLTEILLDEINEETLDD